ncbi:MAG: hypothetical protein KAW93_10780 [Methanogenium sp.]|nr:hypothetical protein [Methanogenium sp.]
MSELQQIQKDALRIGQDLYQEIRKDPLYGPRVQIGIEIGRIIVIDGDQKCRI